MVYSFTNVTNLISHYFQNILYKKLLLVLYE